MKLNFIKAGLGIKIYYYITVRNVRKFTKFLYLKIAKSIINFVKFPLILWNLTEFEKMYFKTTKQ